jgi:hypothetical protein
MTGPYLCTQEWPSTAIFLPSKPFQQVYRPTSCYNFIVPPRWFSLSDRLVANSPRNAAPGTVRAVERHGAWWTGHQYTSILLESVGDERLSH